MILMGFFRGHFHWIIPCFFALVVRAPAQNSSPTTYSVCTWNIENFGLASHHSHDGRVTYVMKPDIEINSVMAILKKLHPDVLGVNEIIQEPTDKYLQLFKKKLKDAGLDYPYASTTRGEDTRIQNLLLSRFPIIEDISLNQDTFEVTQHSRSTGEDRPLKMRMERGIIHCVLQIAPNNRLHVMLVHLKSSLPAPSIISANPHEHGDQVIRHNEALILKSAIDQVLAQDPRASLLVMGDFNDSPRSKTLDILLDWKSATHAVAELPLADYFGDLWTHYYAPTSSYSRIDHMFVSEALFSEFLKDRSFIYRPKPGDAPELSTYSASDHRALYAVFSISGQKP